MKILVTFDSWLRIVEVSSMAFFVLLDTVLLFFIKTNKSLIGNRYYKLQVKFGLLKVTVGKIALASLIAYAILTKQPASSSFISLIIIYGLAVILLLFDFFRSGKNKNQART